MSLSSFFIIVAVEGFRSTLDLRDLEEFDMDRMDLDDFSSGVSLVLSLLSLIFPRKVFARRCRLLFPFSDRSLRDFFDSSSSWDSKKYVCILRDYNLLAVLNSFASIRDYKHYD